MSGAARVVSVQWEVESELFALGLDRQEMREVVEASRWGRENSTEYDPPGYAGWNQYGLGVRSLRQLLIETRDPKWTMCNRKGFCRTISPDRSIAIAVSSGNEATGDPSKNPTTLNPKGPESGGAIAVNRLQLDVFEINRMSVGNTNTASANALPTLWFLLINVRGGEVFAELSLPLALDDDGRVAEWETRIMLLPDLDDGPGGRRSSDDAPDIDIDLVKRTG